MTTHVPALVDRDAMVLVLVDIQGRLAAAMDRRDQVVAAASRLARVAALVSAPVVVTRQYPQGLGDTVPELQSVLDTLASDGAEVLRVDKTAFCCSAEPGFVEALASTARDQVVVAGMETHICVAQTALALSAAGKRVQVVADACCSRDARNHDIALSRLRAAGVVVTTSESVMYEVVGRAATDEFKALLGIVKEP